MITLREYGKKDYEMIAGWWRGHGHDPVPKVVLPKLGVIAIRNHAGEEPEEVAAAWCYMDNSVGVAMMEWIVGKPDVSGIVLKPAFGAIIDFLKNELANANYSVLMSHCGSDKLAGVLSLNGFSRVEKVNHLIMGL